MASNKARADRTERLTDMADETKPAMELEREARAINATARHGPLVVGTEIVATLAKGTAHHNKSGGLPRRLRQS
jgi:hypothetical protein